jgi:hypothetical protein
VSAVEGSSGPDPLDDPKIPDSDALFRRLSDSGPSMVAVDLETGERRPTSGAFKPDDDGVSVFRRGLLQAAGLGPDDIIKRPWNLVVSVEVGDVRSIGLGARDDPWPSDIDEPQHPRNAAHALIVGLERLGRNERRRRQKALVALPSVTFVRG